MATFRIIFLIHAPQVLQKALEVWGLQVIPLSHPDMKAAKADPQAEAAFICNLQVRLVMRDGCFLGHSSMAEGAFRFVTLACGG